MSVYDHIKDRDVDRRLLLLLLVLLLVVVGSGAGTIIFSPPAAPPGDAERTPTPTATETATTQPSPTPVETPGAGDPPDSTETRSPTADDDSTPTTDTPADTPTDTPEDTPTEEPDDDDDNPTTPSPGLEVGDDEPLLSVANLAPGHSGEGTLTLRNGENEDGHLTISAIDIIDEENGIMDAESSVDSSPDAGELSSHLEVRIAIRDQAGNEEYLFGTENDYVTLDELPEKTPSAEYLLGSGEEVTLVADWRLPSSTGNEVQSDGVSIDLGLTLESTDG